MNLSFIRDPRVQEYMRKKLEAERGIDDASTMSDIAGYAGVGTQLLNDLNESRRKDVILHNRLGDLGRAPTVQRGEATRVDPNIASNLASMQMDRARDKSAAVDRQFDTESKVAQMEKSLGMRDPSSPESQQAREFAKYISPRIAEIPGFENLSADRLNSMMPTLMAKMKQDTASKRQETLDKMRMEDRSFDRSYKERQMDLKERQEGPEKYTKQLKQDLAKKNANKISILNQIGSYKDQFDSAKSTDDKVRVGRQMLKVLNSTEGADAIGAEEAKRLGNALEFQIANFLEPGPMFGRDLEGFSRQVDATLKSIEDSIERNQQIIYDGDSPRTGAKDSFESLPDF